MQQIAVPSGSRNPAGHTYSEILAALRGATGVQRWAFRYELLTSANVYKQDLTGVLSCSIDQNWLASIKRTARLSISDTGEINYLQDRIKPYIRLYLPPYGDDDWVEWPQGVFLLTTPKRTSDEAGVVTRDVEAYDQLQVLVDDRVDDRYTVDTGTVYTAAVATLLSGFSVNITTSSSTLPSAKEWDPGTSKLSIINDLLGALNYESLSFDEDGVALVRPYSTPAERASEYTYADDQNSVMLPRVSQELDLFGVANKWVIVVNDPDRAVLTSTYTNSDPGSPTSTVNRQRTIVDFRTDQDAADQTTLDAKVARLAFEASQVYEIIEFTTGIMPFHSGNDVYSISFTPLAVSAKYAEHSWSLNMVHSATMSHRARRVVSVGGA